MTTLGTGSLTTVSQTVGGFTLWEETCDPLVTFIQILVGAAAIFASLKRGPIFYRFSTVRFPCQRLARTVFFVVGAGMMLGGVWSLRLGW